MNLAAPSSPGTYYYGACVDTVTDESDNTNNCSASVKVDVEAPKYPDLEVGTPTVSDTSPETGSSFTLSATVSNTGDGESVATTLRYYRSTDATITTSDTAVGTDAVGALGASGTSAESISLNAPTTAGAYYYGACVDAVKDESDTTDNCSTSMKLDVEAPKYPDLEVGTPTVSDSTTETGASFTLSATVSNTGDGESVATTLRYYRSTDATITTSDTAVGTDAVSGLASSGSSAESISLTAPSTAGTYYYGACVDAVTDESDTTDNCSTSVKLDVEAPKYPDLEVGTPTGERQHAGDGCELYPVGDGEQHGRWRVSGDDAAVLPIDGRDDHDVRHGGGYGRGGCAWGFGDKREVDLADRALDGGHVLLRGVRGRGDGRVGHHEQLFIISDNRCGGAIIGAAGLEDRWANHVDPS